MHFGHELPSQIVVDSNNGCSNELASDKDRSFMPYDTVSTQIQAHRDRARSSEALMSPYFREIKHTILS